MNNLSITQLAAYGVCFINTDEDKFAVIETYDMENNNVKIRCYDTTVEYKTIDQITPYLRSMYNLHKEIQIKGYNNGEKFSPVYVLFGNLSRLMKSCYDFEISNYHTRDNHIQLMCKYFRHKDDKQCYLELELPLNVQVIELLHLWQFDYRDSKCLVREF